MLDRLSPPAAAPSVTAVDGHPRALVFRAGARPCRIASLGVDMSGQSGDLATHKPGCQAPTIRKRPRAT